MVVARPTRPFESESQRTGWAYVHLSFQLQVSQCQMKSGEDSNRNPVPTDLDLSPWSFIRSEIGHVPSRKESAHLKYENQSHKVL